MRPTGTASTRELALARRVGTFSGLADGQYLVSTTWREKSNRATDALYSIEDATATTLAATTIDQQVAPNDRTESGALWEDLATVNITGGTLIVKLTESAGATGQVIADAVRIEKMGDIANALSVVIADDSIAEGDGAAASRRHRHAKRQHDGRFARHAQAAMTLPRPLCRGR